jgi:CheY-like chemotaxis protein/HPt (histidine-containing phosphotransfer) domain-containing protein
VEDNPVNLVVSQRMLEVLGCSVDTASNGREAVAAWSKNRYDIVAMDCQMPEMDGYEATRIIREREQSSGSLPPQTPIFALTAHAMQGDRERCLEAGMNDYLSKPFTLEQLQEVLLNWLPSRDTTDAQRSGNPQSTVPVLQDSPASTQHAHIGPSPGHLPEDDIDCVDRKTLEAIERLQAKSGQNLLEKVIGIYFKDSPKYIDLLKQAVPHGDADTARNAAHSLKSSSGNVGAIKLHDLCKDLETAARENTLETGSEMLNKIEKEYQKVRTVLMAELDRLH